MKYLLLLGAVAVIYFVLLRQSPVTAVKEVVMQTEAAPLLAGARAPTPAPGSGLRRPFDRTRATLDAVEARNGAREF